jgi:methylmalonyl-CoA mutase N-terminal domain/subunit
VDPLAGSYVIEHLTNEIERRALEQIEHIDRLGGALKAIEQGYIQNEIQDSAYRYQQAVETKAQIVVGVNDFTVETPHSIERLAIDPAIETQARARLAALRARRDSATVSERLTRLEAAARGADNLMPLFIDCVQHHITVGEICAVLRRVWGEYRPTQ